MGGGGGGGSSAPRNTGGGGGGGNSRPAPAPKPTPKPSPSTPVNVTPRPSPALETVTTYLDSGSGESGKPSAFGAALTGAANNVVSSYIGGGSSSSAGGVTDTSVTKFIPGEGEGTKSDALDSALGELPTHQYFGTSPFHREGIKRGEGYLGSRMRGTSEVPGLDSTVESQENAPAVGGGEVGVGQQGFGQRALIGGEGAIVEAAGAESNAVQSAVPAETAPSDLQTDPNYVMPAPGKEAIYDYNYTVPMVNNENVVGFRPGSRDAAARARGPISRGLMSARSGFGRRFF